MSEKDQETREKQKRSSKKAEAAGQKQDKKREAWREAVVEAVKAGERFLSLEDFWQKTKVPKGTIDLMADMGIFGDLPKTNQISLFDLAL